jgi:hypothetical protein
MCNLKRGSTLIKEGLLNKGTTSLLRINFRVDYLYVINKTAFD